MTHPELSSEQSFIAHAEHRLDVIRAEAAAVGEEVVAGERGGQGQLRLERDLRVGYSLRRLQGLRLGDEPLVIGRIDSDDGGLIRVGRLAIDDADREPLIIDWRAPVAAPFYRATPLDRQGVIRRRHYQYRKRQLVDIDDEVLDVDAAESRELVLVGEAVLLAALERARTGRMGDIVATIQREQDEVIRTPMGGVLAVEGGPGTGKTAVALHRAAYLLYSHRLLLESTGVLLIGPNPVFLRYVEQVLPALGEHTVTMATPGTLVHDMAPSASDTAAAARVKGDLRMIEVLRRAIRRLARPLKEDLVVPHGPMRLVLSRDESRLLLARARRAGGTHNVRRRLVERLVLDHLMTARFEARRKLVVAGRLGSAAVAKDAVDEASLRAELSRSPEVRRAVNRLWPVLDAADVVDIVLTHPKLLSRAARELLDQAEIDAITRPKPADKDDRRWTPADIALVDEARVLVGEVSTAKPARGKNKKARPEEDPDAIAEQIFTERVMADQTPPCPACDQELTWDPQRRRWVCGHVGCGETYRADQILPPEQVHLYESVRSHVTEGVGRGESQVEASVPGVDRIFGHVLVDEAQDLSPMQWRMIARRCPGRSMTISGDLAQGSEAWAQPDWDAVLAPLLDGTEVPVRRACLTVNYRTPAEVMAIASRVLAIAAPNQPAPVSARRSGVTPQAVVVDEGGDVMGATVEAVRTARREAGDGRAAVIAPESSIADIRTGLDPDLLASDGPDSDVLDAPVAVLSLADSKGLEFDAVVVVDPDQLAAEHAHGLQALYVALTRTTRWLTIVAPGPVPSWLPEGDRLD